MSKEDVKAFLLNNFEFQYSRVGRNDRNDRNDRTQHTFEYNVTIGKFLSEGNYGMVFKGIQTLKRDGRVIEMNKPVAVKVLTLLQPDILQAFTDEIELSKMDLRYSVTLRAMLVNLNRADKDTDTLKGALPELLKLNSKNLYTVELQSEISVIEIYDFINGDDLATILKTTRPLSERTVIEFTYDLLEGLYEFNEHWTHRDIKASNVMLHTDPDTNESHLMYIDFGLLCEISPTTGELKPNLHFDKHGYAISPYCSMDRSILGDLQVIPPEMYRCATSEGRRKLRLELLFAERSSREKLVQWRKVDVFSVGILIAQLIVPNFEPIRYIGNTLRKTYGEDLSTQMLYFKIFENLSYPEINALIQKYVQTSLEKSELFYLIPAITRMLEANPALRPSPADAYYDVLAAVDSVNVLK